MTLVAGGRGKFFPIELQGFAYNKLINWCISKDYQTGGRDCGEEVFKVQGSGFWVAGSGFGGYRDTVPGGGDGVMQL